MWLRPQTKAFVLRVWVPPQCSKRTPTRSLRVLTPHEPQGLGNQKWKARVGLRLFFGSPLWSEGCFSSHSALKNSSLHVRCLAHAHRHLPSQGTYLDQNISQTLHVCHNMPTLGWCQGGQLIGILWQSHGSSCLGYGPLPRDSTSCDIPAYPADPTRPRLATEPGRPTVQGLRSGDSPRRGATDRRTNAARHDASHEGREVAGFRHE